MNRCFLAGLAGLFTLGSANAATLIPVPPVPGSVDTAVFGINDNNVVAGSYLTSDGIEHGFFGPLSGGSYTTVDESSTSTEIRGIDNSGLLTGIALNADGSFYQPFERFADGSVAFVTYNGAPLGQGIAGAINSAGVFTASGWDQNFTQFFGFLGQNAQYVKSVKIAGAYKTYPRGINDSESQDLVGFYYANKKSKNPHGFSSIGGATQTIDYPDPREHSTTLYGINNDDLIVGTWSDRKGRPFAFIYNPSTGAFTPLRERNVKYGQYAQAFGINNAGLVAVNFVAADGPFIYCPRKPDRCPAGGKEIPDEPSVHVPSGESVHYAAQAESNIRGARVQPNPDRLLRKRQIIP